MMQLNERNDQESENSEENEYVTSSSDGDIESNEDIEQMKNETANDDWAKFQSQDQNFNHFRSSQNSAVMSPVEINNKFLKVLSIWDPSIENDPMYKGMTKSVAVKRKSGGTFETDTSEIAAKRSRSSSDSSAAPTQESPRRDFSTASSSFDGQPKARKILTSTPKKSPSASSSSEHGIQKIILSQKFHHPAVVLPAEKFDEPKSCSNYFKTLIMKDEFECPEEWKYLEEFRKYLHGTDFRERRSEFLEISLGSISKEEERRIRRIRERKIALSELIQSSSDPAKLANNYRHIAMATASEKSNCVITKEVMQSLISIRNAWKMEAAQAALAKLKPKNRFVLANLLATFYLLMRQDRSDLVHANAKFLCPIVYYPLFTSKLSRKEMAQQKEFELAMVALYKNFKDQLHQSLPVETLKFREILEKLNENQLALPCEAGIFAEIRHQISNIKRCPGSFAERASEFAAENFISEFRRGNITPANVKKSIAKFDQEILGILYKEFALNFCHKNLLFTWQDVDRISEFGLKYFADKIHQSADDAQKLFAILDQLMPMSKMIFADLLLILANMIKRETLDEDDEAFYNFSRGLVKAFVLPPKFLNLDLVLIIAVMMKILLKVNFGMEVSYEANFLKPPQPSQFTFLSKQIRMLTDV